MSKSDEALSAITDADTERFWAKVDQSGECWLWTGCKLPSGYGKFGVGGVVVTAHRFALAVRLGRPPRHQAIHSCDNPSCVNPGHLRDGTQVENMADCRRRGRFSPPPTGAGERNNFARLTESDVRLIRERAAAGVTLVQLARDHRVTPNCIGAVLRRRTWAHVA